ncbi:hypothetical protein JL721_3286 [Aureococcus anophagefferens]|nr:hypothetical protein JL721_3286 [Aureococcus anophagefferens]
MGTCASSEAQREAMLIDKMPARQRARPRARRVPRQMEEELKKASVADEALVKLLILGAGESGKSTLFKQMKLMRALGAARRQGAARARRGGAARARRRPRAEAGRPQARRPSREEQHYMRGGGAAARATLAANLPNFDIDIEVVDKAALATVLEADEDAALGGELGERVRRRPAAAAPATRAPPRSCVERLWREEAIQAMRARRVPRPVPPGRRGRWKLRGHVQIVESVVYFFEKIAELKRGDYVATVRTRGRRAGPPRGASDDARPQARHRHVKYTIKGKDYEMYDVGGQRNERRKFEDETTNRMKDALDLFEEVCDNRHFSNVEANGFPDYAGKANDYADGVRYFTDKFLRKNKDPERTIFCHVTCATDTSNARLRRVFRGFARGGRGPQVRAVMDMCYHVITQKKLESIGFM